MADPTCDRRRGPAQRRRRSAAPLIAVAAAIACAGLGGGLAGCGAQDPGGGGGNGGGGGTGVVPDGGGGIPAAQRLLPFATGHTWTYRVTDERGVVAVKVHTIGDAEVVGGSGPHAGAPALKVTTMHQFDRTVSWQAELGTQIVRYREQSYGVTSGALTLEEHWDPPKLRVDETPARTRAGAAWREDYVETKLPVGDSAITASGQDDWMVLTERETVTVPAGTFEAVVIKKTSRMAAVKTYWFVRGIGKVKETGGQVEELASYQLAP